MSEAPSDSNTLFGAAIRSAFRAAVQNIADLRPTDALTTCSDDVLFDAKEQVLKAVSHEISSFLLSLNARSNPASLVPELLTDILGYLSIRDRFSATEVCQHWRTVAINAPCIWTDISGFGLVSPRLTIALQRARNTPIRLGFTLPSILITYNAWSASVATHRADRQTQQTLAFLTCLSQRMAHVTSLDITAYGAGLCLAPLHDALSHEAPLLKFFRLEFVTPSHQLRGDLFAGHAPRLHTLELVQALPPTDATRALHAVRQLRLSSGALENVESKFAVLFVNLPHLTELEFDATSCATIIYYSSAVSAARYLSALVPELRSLHFPRDSRPLLFLPHGPCKRVSLTAPYADCLEALWVENRLPSRMIIASDTTGSVFLGGRDDAGALRLISNTFLHNGVAHALIGGAILTWLRALVIDTRSWLGMVLSYAPQTVLPHLKFLHLLVYVQESLKSRCQRPPDWLHAPGLNVLRVSVVAIRDNLQHCDDEVCAAIDRFVGLVAPPTLDFIEFDNAGLQNFPSGCVRRKSTVPLEPFLSEHRGRSVRWDEWLENAVASIPDF